MIYNNLIDMIGNTPIVKLNNIVNENMAEVYVKLEKYNPAGSIKDRAALGMIEDAEERGLLKKDSVIVEPTSGNTGIALAMIGKLKGYKVIIVMPDSMSLERRNMISAYGAQLVLTEGSKGMQGAIDKAEELLKENPNYFIPQQFENYSNTKKHYESTAIEILTDFPQLDAFVAGVGTSGTLMGIGRKLKEERKNIQIVAVEPASSPVLSGGKAGSHKIQGIGANFIPALYDKLVVDSIIQVTDEDALKMTPILTKEEGLFLGISAAANVFAAIELAKTLGKGHKVLTIAPDGGEKYLSTGIFN